MIGVIGGLGLIGKEVVQILKNQGKKVLIADQKGPKSLEAEWTFCDITDYNSLAPLSECEEIYNFAGLLGTSELNTQIYDAVKVNVLGAVNVFEFAKNNKIKKVFYPSKPNVWNNIYTITKKTSEDVIEFYNKISETKIYSLRIFNVYGPGQSIFPVRKIIPTFAIQALRGEPIQIWGDGSQTVDLIYSKDLANIIVNYMETNRFGIIECGSGEEMTVNSVAKIINEFFGNKSTIQHLPMRSGETPNTRLVANCTEIKDILKDKFQISNLLKTMYTTLEYYKLLPEETINKAIDFYRK